MKVYLQFANCIDMFTENCWSETLLIVYCNAAIFKYQTSVLFDIWISHVLRNSCESNGLSMNICLTSGSINSKPVYATEKRDFKEIGF